MKRFTPIEDDLIRQIYPKHGAAGCRRVMPDRSQQSIQDRAHYIGVRSEDGERMRERMRKKPEGRYPWPPLSDLDRAGMKLWGYAARTGQLRPIVKVELEKVA